MISRPETAEPQNARGGPTPRTSLASTRRAHTSGHRRSTKRFEFLIEWTLFLCALLSIGTTVGIIIVLAALMGLIVMLQAYVFPWMIPSV